MSNRAYRCELKLVDNSTFNAWADEDIIYWLQTNTSFMETLGDGPSGLSCITIKEWKRLLKDLKDKIDEETVKQIKKDIEWAKKNKKNYINYYVC